jgi:hypothetical protein
MYVLTALRDAAWSAELAALHDMVPPGAAPPTEPGGLFLPPGWEAAEAKRREGGTKRGAHPK